MTESKSSYLNNLSTVIFAVVFALVAFLTLYFGGDRAPYIALFALPALLNATILILIIRKRIFTTSSIWFLLFAVALLIWAISDIFSTATNSGPVWEFFVLTAVAGYVFLPIMFVNFALSYVGKKYVKNIYYLITIILSGIIFLFLGWTTDTIIVRDFSQATLQPWGYIGPTAKFFPLFLLWFEALTIFGLVQLIKYRLRITSVDKKKKTTPIIIGALIPLISGTITNGILPILNINIFPTAVPLTSAMSVLIGYAILKHGLFDINALDVAENIIDAIPEAIIVLDQNNKIRSANPKAKDVFGASQELNIRKIINQKTLDILAAPHPAFISQIELKTRNNQIIFGSIASSPILDRDGKYLGSSLIISDISSLIKTQIELEKRIKESQRSKTDLENTKAAILNLLEDLEHEKARLEEATVQNEALFASIGEGVIAADEYGKINKINQAALDFLILEEKNVLDVWLPKAIPAYDENGVRIDPINRPAVRCLQEARTIGETLFFKKSDGTLFPAFVTASPVLLGGKAIGVVSVFRDISREREIDKAKTEFISLASHQLRTPLSAIKWFSEMLLDGDAGPLNKTQKEFVNNVSISGDRMIELVNTLLNIARIESGRINISPQPTDLPILANQIITELTPKIMSKKQKLIVSSHPKLPKIQVDPQLIREVYSNILTNAVKYTPEKGEIHVFLSKKGPDVITQISDTGYGIPVKDQKKIFSKFFRGDNIIKIETSGTGLGLYLTKAIVDSSQGKIWFKSDEGKGTTFWISLPISGIKPRAGDVGLEKGNLKNIT